MDEDTQNKVAATLAAHERVLTFLLADYLKRLSPAQRLVIDATLVSEEAILQLPPGLNLDIGQVDDLAGLAMAYAAAMKRLFDASLVVADALRD